MLKIEREVNKIITNSFGYSFGPGVRFGGLVIFIVGIVSFLTIIGPIVALIAGVAAFGKSGVVINVEVKKYKEYLRCYGIEFGKWNDLSPFVALAVLKLSRTHTVHSRTNRTMTNTDTTFDICLLNNNHHKKIPVKRCNSIEEANIAIKELSEQLGIEAVKYNPVRTARTRRR